MAIGSSVPTIDLGPFLEEGDESRKKTEILEIIQACSEYGFFKVANHGVPSELINQTLEFLRTFFKYPAEEKESCIPNAGSVYPVGYLRPPDGSVEYFEHLMVAAPNLGANVYPKDFPELQEALEALFPYMSKLALLVESIISVCLGLNPEFLNEYNNGKAYDMLVGFRYPPATETSAGTGKIPHEDGTSITLLLQDQVGGLEVEKDGEWIPVAPADGTLVVNIGDIIQVMSNKKFKSATHRVLSPKEESRYSIVFAHFLPGDKWVEPLPHFTSQIGESPKYRGFLYQDYMKLRFRDRENPHTKQEDYANINHYLL